MKNETRIRIKESRRRYFQEVMKQQVEQNHPRLRKRTSEAPTHDSPPVRATGPGIELRSKGQRITARRPKWDAARSWHQLKGRIPEVTMPGFMSRDNAVYVLDQIRKPISKAGRELSSKRQRVSFAVNQRADRAIDRFNDYMMVIFDA